MFLSESLDRACTTTLLEESPNRGLKTGKIAQNLKKRIESKLIAFPITSSPWNPNLKKRIESRYLNTPEVGESVQISEKTSQPTGSEVIKFVNESITLGIEVKVITLGL